MGVRSFQRNRTLVWTSTVLGLLAGAGALLSLLARWRSGRGLEPYVAAGGFETNAVQVIATILAVAVAFAVHRVVRALRRKRAGAS